MWMVGNRITRRRYGQQCFTKVMIHSMRIIRLLEPHTQCPDPFQRCGAASAIWGWTNFCERSPLRCYARDPFSCLCLWPGLCAREGRPRRRCAMGCGTSKQGSGSGRGRGRGSGSASGGPVRWDMDGSASMASHHPFRRGGVPQTPRSCLASNADARSRAGRLIGLRAGRNAAHRAGVGGRCRRRGHHGGAGTLTGRHILPSYLRVKSFWTG